MFPNVVAFSLPQLSKIELVKYMRSTTHLGLVECKALTEWFMIRCEGGMVNSATDLLKFIRFAERIRSHELLYSIDTACCKATVTIVRELTLDDLTCNY